MTDYDVIDTQVFGRDSTCLFKTTHRSSDNSLLLQTRQQDDKNLWTEINSAQSPDRLQPHLGRVVWFETRCYEQFVKNLSRVVVVVDGLPSMFLVAPEKSDYAVTLVAEFLESSTQEDIQRLAVNLASRRSSIESVRQSIAGLLLVLDQPQLIWRTRPLLGSHLGANFQESASKFAFIQEADELERNGSVGKALDIVYQAIDDFFHEGKFSVVDEILQQAQASVEGVNVLVGLLTATLPAKTRLPHRIQFYDWVKTSLVQRDLYEDGLLNGLD